MRVGWRGSLTDTSLDVGVVAPSSVPLTGDGGLVVARAGVPPALPPAVVLDGRGVGPRVHSVSPRPVGHAEVVLVDREGSLSTVYGCKQSL